MEERDIVVVGSGPAGLSAAVFAKLDGWSTVVLEGRWVGGQTAIAYTVTNYLGFPPGDGADLARIMEEQATAPPPAGVGIELKHEKALSLDAGRLLATTDVNRYKGKAIILATGSTMQTLGVPGEERFLDNGVSYYAERDAGKFAGGRVLIVGGGNTTAKSALVAKTTASEVVLVHRRESLRAYPAMVARMQKEGIDIRYNTEVAELKGGSRLERAVVVNNKTGEEMEMAVDWVVICVGTEPNSELAREAGLDMSGHFVDVDAGMMTSKPGVFACGEMTGCDRHMITSASTGAAAGMAASEYLAMERVKRGDLFEGAKNGKYADEFRV